VPLGVIDWTQVIVAAIGASGAIVSAAISAYVWWQIRTPSGDKIGAVAERTHDVTHATNALLVNLNGELHGETPGVDE
jgi:hypothetical protein